MTYYKNTPIKSRSPYVEMLIDDYMHEANQIGALNNEAIITELRYMLMRKEIREFLKLNYLPEYFISQCPDEICDTISFQSWQHGKAYSLAIENFWCSVFTFSRCVYLKVRNIFKRRQP